MQKKYLVNADIIRIIAGFAVVFIHVTDPFLAYPPYYGVGGFPYLILSFLNALSRVCVPLFIMLSGYLLLKPEKTIRIHDFYVRRITRIGIPILFWFSMYFFTLSQTGNHLSFYSLFNSILSVNIGMLYFLIIIFELYIITPLLLIFLKRAGKGSGTAIFIFLTLGLNTITTYLPNTRFLLDGNIFTIFIPFISYYLGGYYLRNITPSSTQRVILLFGLWVILLLTLFSTDNTAVSVVNTQERQFDSINVLIMSILVFILFINNSFIRRCFSKPPALFCIKIVAGSIFGIYLVHQYILMLFNNYTHLNPGNIYSPMLLFVFLKIIAVFAISFGIVAIGRKIPILNKVFGE